MVYMIIISLIGCLLLFFLSLASFSGMEALRLKEDIQVSRGFQLLLSSIVSFLIIHITISYMEFMLDTKYIRCMRKQ